MTNHSIKPILYPASIAVIGASKDQTKRGFRAILKLLEDGFRGEIYPVNPKEAEILGLTCYPSIGDVPGEVDLALICTPAATLPKVMQMCGEKGVKGAVVLAGGFAEAGEDGKRLQDEMVQVSRAHGVRIIGPNTSGMVNTHQNCNIAGFSNLRKGGIGLLSQSGNMALQMVTEAQSNGLVGLSTYVGIGNESDIGFHEYLAYFAEDDNTSVVIAYIEGLKQGRAFLDALQEVTSHKPVVIFKSGRSNAGQNAAKSHTGALAGDYAVSEGVLRQAGAILVNQSDEILPVAEALSLLGPMPGRRIAVLADGGGHATIAADALSERGLKLAQLSDDTKQRLRTLLPAAASVANPVDVAGGTDANPALFADCAAVLLDDPEVDGLLIAGLYGGYGLRFSESLLESELATSDRIAELQRHSCKAVVVYSLYGTLAGEERPAPLRLLREDGIPVYGSLEIAVRSLQALAEVGEARSRRHVHLSSRTACRQTRMQEVLARCAVEERAVVLEHEARAVLQAAGLDLAPAPLATTADEAEAAFDRLGGGAVAMKIVSKDILHKSDVGGVKLGLGNGDDVRKAFAEILHNGSQAVADAEIAGVLVTPMAPRGGVEVIIGVVRDPQYGPVMMFGLGGVLVEVLKDVAFRALPLSEADARAMLNEIKAREILAGVRGQAAVDVEALIKLMLTMSELCTAFPEIAELDLNPVMAYRVGADILDARILLDRVPQPEQQSA